MTKTYNLYNLEAPFKEYLVAGNQKDVSIKNYLSDFRHFAGWVMSKGGHRGPPLQEPITLNDISGYKSYLESNNIPHKTVNRRLSTLRKFCSFCISQGWMKENPAKQISNISVVGNDPRVVPIKALVSPEQMSFLQRWKSKSRDVINHVFTKYVRGNDKEGGHGGPPLQGFQQYIAFLIILIFMAVMGAGVYNQFFVKNRQSLAYPITPTFPGVTAGTVRILSFQGRLTDTLSNPITTATNVVFQLYSVSSGGVALYTTGTCSVTPDQDGIFSSLIGSTCGSGIDASVFTENANIYLGVTVGADAEMTPRQQIANVGYAINSETLQGLPPGSNVSNIPYINSQGNLLIAATNPGLHSTYASSTFTISSAQATTIQSAGTGDIVLQATESGSLIFRTGGATDTYTRITVDNNGLVGIGDTTPLATLTVGDGDLFQVAGATGNVLTSGTMTAATDETINGIDISSGTVSDVVNLTINTGGDLTIGAIGLNDVGTTNITSGASLVGVFDEFDNSASTTVQDVLDDLDAAITTGGGSSMWSLTSGVIYPTTVTNDLAIGGTTLAASMFGIDESAGNFYFGYDNSANPTLNFEATDADAGEFGFNTNDAFYFSNANVGIGTTGPGAKLEVDIDSSTAYSATAYAIGVNANDALNLYNANASAALTSIRFLDRPSGASVGRIGLLNNGTADGSGDFVFMLRSAADTSNTDEMMRITSTGNVGIGTTGPGYKLDVSGNARITSEASIGSYIVVGGNQVMNGSEVYWSNEGRGGYNFGSLAGGGAKQFNISSGSVSYTGGLITLSTDGSERMRINSSGNVGIGTTGPEYLLHLQAAVNPVIATKDTTNNVVAKLQSLDTIGLVGTESNHNFQIFTVNTPKVTVDTTGNVGIGTTSPGYKLDVSDNVKIGTNLGVGTSPNITRSINALITNTDAASDTYGNYFNSNFNVTTNNANIYSGTQVVVSTSATANDQGYISGLNVNANGNATGGTTLRLLGISGQAVIGSTAAYTETGGLSYLLQHFGTGTVATAYGADLSSVLRSSGTGVGGNITNAYGVSAGISNVNTEATPGVITNGTAFYAKAPAGTGLITSNYGIRAANQGRSGITNAYGLYLDNQTGAATNNYAIYSVGGNNYFGGNVGIGTTAPAATSILDLTSTTKGFLAPRMTTTERDAITTPATGLMIYNTTDNQYNVFNGTTWGAVGGAGGGAWSDLTLPTANLALAMGTYTSTFTYNATTSTNNLFNLTDTLNNTGTGYLLNLTTASGSTLKPFHVSAAGTEALIVLADGKVGIGTTAPSNELEVNGDIELTNLFDNDASNFFDGGCSSSTSLTGIDSTGAITCTAITGVPASAVSFENITSGTNTTAAMVVGAGASLNYTSTGTINASSLIGGTWAIPGTIGSTTPNTGAFTTLSSTGTTTLGDAIGDAVTINAGAWTFANDTNFALTGGVNGLSFDGTTFSVDGLNNRIGIGTAAPTDTLEVNGGILGSYFLDHSNTAYGIDPANTTAFGNSISMQISGGALLALDEGRVGIGVASPAEILDVGGNATVSGNLTFTGATSTIANRLMQNLTIGDSQTGNIVLANNVTLTTGSVTSSVVDSSTAMGFTLNTTSLTTQGAKLLSLQNAGTEKFYIDKDGNLYAAGTILSGNGTSMLLTNKSGGIVASKAIVVLDTSNNTSFTTTTTPYSKAGFGVVVGVGLGVTNDADGDGVCDANDICMVAYAGSVNVTVKNATTAAKGEYLFTSDTAGSAVASAKQYDGLVGIVDDTTNAASGYLKMIFKVQPQVTAAASIDKGTKHNEYWLYADQYKETGEGSDTDTNLLARGLMFDTLSDSTKTDSANTTASLNTAVQKTGLIGGQTLATSTTDNAGNTYLGSNTVNKVFYYDRTSPGVSPGSPGVGRVGDSSPQVQVELGIDPNWYNGVTLSVATTSAQFSQNSTITKPNPNLSTSYNGSLIKVTGTDTTPRTIYITIKSPTTFDWTNYQGDSATGVTITPGTAQTLGTTGVSANFTDARYNTGDVFKIASWFIEPSSSTRGAKQQFPERSYVIATASSVDIIDADTQKLWMRFSQGTSYAIGVDANNDPSSANMLNGKAYISTNGSSATGLYTLDFVHDAVFKQNATDYRLSDTAIYGRNGTNTYNVINTSNILVNITANDVSSAVIPNQPTQNVTVSGWGYTYVVAGAASSESVNLPYKFNDIPRVSVNTIGITSTAPTSLSNCGSNPSNYLFAGMSPTNSSFSVFGNITSGTISGTYYYCYSWTATGQVSPRTYVAAATDAGVTVVNETDSTAYSYSDVTGDDYNSVQLTTTGKMYALNETQAILEKWRDIASNTSSETNGTPDKWWGETAADVLLDRDFTNYTGSTYVLSAKATHNGAAARAISQNFDIAGSGTTPVTAIKVIADQAGVSGTASMEVRSGSVTLTTAVGDDAYTLGTSAVTGGVATNTYDMSAVSAGQTLTFNFSGLTLTKGSTYTFILYTSTDNGTTGMSLKVGNTDYGSYRRSVNMYHADNGWDNLTSWYGTGGTTDLAFQVLKNNVTIPVLTASIPTIPTNPSLSVTEKTSPMGPNSDTIYVGTNQGVSVIQDKESDSTANDGTDETNGSVKYYTKDYISEEMVGDIRGMWPLNNANSSSDFEDVSVKANTLTGTNITAAGDSVSGVRGTATDFDGSTESLTIADDADLDFAASEKFTVGLWNKHNGAISTNFDYLMTKADATTGGYKLYMDDSGDYCFTIDDDSSWTPDDSACTSGIDYDDSNWHYVQGVKDATTGIYLYVDGKLVASDTSIAATGTLANTNAFYIGVDRDGTSNEWDGYIDEPFVTATALSAGQIRHMYQVGYRALQSHATTLGGGAADTNQQLGMISTGTNTVGDARVDYNNQFMYVGTNSTTLGAVSKIDLNSDTNIKTYNSSANVPTGGALLIDEDTKSLAVGYNLEAVGSATGGVKTMGVDNNAMATSGNFIGKTVTTAESFTQAYLWAQYTLDSSDASNTITVSASNDGGSNYSQCNLTNTDTSQSPTEYEYFCQFNTAGSSLKTKFAFARGSTKTNTYVTRYGIAWIGSDAIAGAPGGNGLYTNNNASVANGSYIDVAHNQNSNDVVTNGWWYNTTTSKWEAIDGNNNSDIDLMEYSTNATAQAAYVTNGGASADVATGGTATASLETEPASEAFDDVWGGGGNRWFANATGTQWLKYDLGASVTKTVQRYTFQSYDFNSSYHPTAWTFEGSNNDSDWTVLDTQSGISWSPATEIKTFSFANSTAYRYYRILMTATTATGYIITEMDMFEFSLQDYSESSLKTQGSYSLRGIGQITTALNKTLTRTVSPTINLTDVTLIKFDMRASRTGSNIKIGIHDSGGTTTEITPSISTADTYQTVSFDISAVSNANKDNIDSIIVTVTNADATNNFYIDNMQTSASYFKITQQDANTVRLYNYSGSAQNLRLDVITGGLGRNAGTVSLAPAAADVDSQANVNSLWINKTGTGGNLLKLQTSGVDVLSLATTGTMTLTGNFLPGTDNTYALGSTSNRWKDLFLGPASLHISSTTGTSGVGANYVDGTLGYSSNALTLATAVTGTVSGGGSINLTSGLALGNTTTSAFNLTTTADFGATDEVLQIGDSAGSFMTVLGNGNVGIGTTAPASALDIDTGSNTLGLRLRGLDETVEISDIYIGASGNLVLNNTVGTDTAGMIDFRSEDDNYGYIFRDSSGVSTTRYLNIYVTDAATDYTNFVMNAATSTTGFVLDSAGNVGIGTTAPGAKLDVNGALSVGTGLTAVASLATGDILSGGTTGIFQYDASADALYLQKSNSGTGGTNITGRKSRGTPNSPSGITSGDDVFLLRGYAFGADPGGGGWVETGRITFDTEGTISELLIPGSMYFYTTNISSGTLTEALRIDSTQYVGIGAINPSVSLDVNGSIEYTGTITDVSDARLKENFTQITNPLNKILSLNAYQFNMIGQDSTKLELGYKAQDVQTIFPELISVTDPENGYLGINYIGLIPAITEAIKEQQTQIASLSGQLAGLTLTATGDLEIKNVSQTSYVYDGNLDIESQKLEVKSQNYNLKVKSGEIITRIGAFSELVVGRIKSGFIETENLIVNNTLVAKNIMTENFSSLSSTIYHLSSNTLSALDASINRLIVTEKIVSPIVETEKIITNEIKPKNGDLVVDLTDSTDSIRLNPIPSDSTNKGALARLIIKGLEGKTVTIIDSAGNASFSGQIIADSLTINNDATVAGNFASNTLTVNDASVSGKLIAREIESDTISSLNSQLANSETNINDIQKLLADIKNNPIPDPNYYQNIDGLKSDEIGQSQIQSEAADSIRLNPILSSLIVTGQSNLYSVSVSNSLLVGTMIIDQNSIISLASELKLSALSTINLFDGAVIIAKDGKITTRGEIIAEGGIRTDEIKSLTDGGQVTIKNLTINNLTFDKISTNSAIIAAPDNFAQNGIFAPAIETATASAGLGILPADQSEVIIYNDRVTDDSLIYLTPYRQGNALSLQQDLTLGEKSTGGKPYFKVVTNTPSMLPIKFNWLIIN